MNYDVIVETIDWFKYASELSRYLVFKRKEDFTIDIMWVVEGEQPKKTDFFNVVIGYKSKDGLYTWYYSNKEIVEWVETGEITIE